MKVLWQHGIDIDEADDVSPVHRPPDYRELLSAFLHYIVWSRTSRWKRMIWSGLSYAFNCVTVCLFILCRSAPLLVGVHSLRLGGFQRTTGRRPLPDIQGGNGQHGRQRKWSTDRICCPRVAAIHWSLWWCTSFCLQWVAYWSGWWDNRYG